MPTSGVAGSKVILLACMNKKHSGLFIDKSEERDDDKHWDVTYFFLQAIIKLGTLSEIEYRNL